MCFGAITALPAMGRVPSVLRHYCVLRSCSTSFCNGGLLAAMTVQHKRGIKSQPGKIILSLMSLVASILRAQFFVEMWTTGTTSDLTGIYRVIVQNGYKFISNLHAVSILSFCTMLLLKMTHSQGETGNRYMIQCNIPL